MLSIGTVDLTEDDNDERSSSHARIENMSVCHHGPDSKMTSRQYVYRELTSSVSRMLPGGRGPKLEIFSKKSLVSLMYDGICTTRGRRW